MNRLWMHLLLAIGLAASMPVAHAVTVAELVFVGATTWMGAQAGRQFAKSSVKADKQERAQLSELIIKGDERIADRQKASLFFKKQEKADQDCIFNTNTVLLQDVLFLIKDRAEAIRLENEAINDLTCEIGLLDKSLAVNETKRIEQGAWVGAFIGALAGIAMVHSSHVEDALVKQEIAQEQACVYKEQRAITHENIRFELQEHWGDYVRAFAWLNNIVLEDQRDDNKLLKREFMQSVYDWMDEGCPGLN